MGEGQMEKLKNRKEGSKSIDKPMFVFFSDTSCQVEIV